VTTAKFQQPEVQLQHVGARAFLQTLGANVTIQLLAIGQGVLLARLLSPTGRGEFAAAILWPTIFAAIGGCGVSTALARQAARGEDFARITRTGLYLSCLTGLLTLGLCAISLPFLLNDTPPSVLLGAKWFLAYIVFNHIAIAFVAIDQGAGRFGRYNLTRLILNPVHLGLMVILWLIGVRDVVWFVVSLMIANGVVAAVRLCLGLRGRPIIGHGLSLVKTLREALPFGLANLITPLFQHIDKALLLYLLGTRELGIYTVALAAASVANSLAGSAQTVSFSIAAQAGALGGFERVAKVFRLTACLWITAGIPLAVILPWLLPLLYGREFADAVLPSILLLPAMAFAGQANILEQALRGQGRPFAGLEARIVAIAVFALATLLLVSKWAILGVVAAFIIAQAILLLALVLAAGWHWRMPVTSLLVLGKQDFVELAGRLYGVLGILLSLRKNKHVPTP
jgi:enterobacterial common antigen flippase